MLSTHHLKSASKTPNNKGELYYDMAMSELASDELCVFGESPFVLLKRAAQLKYIPAMLELVTLMIADQQSDKNEIMDYLNYAEQEKFDSPLLTFYLGYCCEMGFGTKVDSIRAVSYFDETIKKINLLKTKEQSTTWPNTIASLANYHLGHLYYHGIDGKSDFNKVMLYMTAADIAGNDDAAYDLTVMVLAQSMKCTVEPEKKIQLQNFWLKKLKKLADKNYVEAQYDLGRFFIYSNELKQQGMAIATFDIKSAMDLFWSAGMNGKAAAFYELYALYSAKKENQLAIQLLKLGAGLRHTECRFEYAVHINSLNTASAEEKLAAERDLKELADDKHRGAQFEYAEINLAKFKSRPNDEEYSIYFDLALRYYSLAGQNGDVYSVYQHATVLVEFPGQKFQESFAQAHDLLLSIRVGDNEELARNINRLLIILADRTKRLANASQPIQIKSQPKNTSKRKVKSFFTYPKSEVDLSVEPKMAVKNLIIEKDITASFQEIKLGEADEAIKAPCIAAKLPKPLPACAVTVLNLLSERNYTAYIKGGLIRNYFFGNDSEADDIDIITDAPIAIIEGLFRTARHEQMQNFCRFVKEGRIFDINCVPDLKNNLMEYVSRADFTINSLLASANGDVWDLTGRGMTDLTDIACQLKPILSAQENYRKDPLRILRYIYFCGCGFKGDISQSEMAQHLTVLRDKFDVLNTQLRHASADNFETCANDKIELQAKLNTMICKFFMSGKAEAILNLLIEFKFFPLLYPGTSFDLSSRKWLGSQFSKIDTMFKTRGIKSISKADLYASLLAAMMDLSNDITGDFSRMMDKHPFPTELRWQLKPDQIKSLINDKIIFSNLTTSSFEHIKGIDFESTNLSKYKNADTWSSTVNAGYQHFRHFSTASEKLVNPLGLAPPPQHRPSNAFKRI